MGCEEEPAALHREVVDLEGGRREEEGVVGVVPTRVDISSSKGEASWVQVLNLVPAWVEVQECKQV